MQTISLCMIVKNEELCLGNCLSSVRDIVDEIVVVDTGSEDATKAIALQYTDKVYDFPWTDDFSSARNYSFEQATKEYILWLDADDIIRPGDQVMLKQLKDSLDSCVDCVLLKYNTGFDLYGNITFSYYRERLVKRERHFQWKEPVHEYLEVFGNIISSEVSVTHTKTQRTHSDRNLVIYERLLSEKKALSPRGIYYYARELKDNERYQKAIHFFNLFLDTGDGWKEDNITACAELAACYEHEKLPTQQHLALLRSFLYDTPRAEICCGLGYLYKAIQDYRRAAFWFQLATTLQKPENGYGFIREECWGYIPLMELAVCYDKLGMISLAEECNESAAKLKPEDYAVKYNRQYFQSVRSENNKVP
ncbi:MAG: glycosyltransferase family 2 protein [Oscillospiraceae bacterium]|nr:glycosyltransferase family 2 protein [Oscillospiraceae bacterium]